MTSGSQEDPSPSREPPLVHWVGPQDPLADVSSPRDLQGASEFLPLRAAGAGSGHPAAGPHSDPAPVWLALTGWQPLLCTILVLSPH